VNPQFKLRPAEHSDHAAIRRMIYQASINPLGLNWRRFVVITDQKGELAACGQIKPHRDGSHEMASLAVLPDYRGQGLARSIIEHLLEQAPRPVYLTCRGSLERLYQKFGFHTVELPQQMPL
jgi:N-acetylglutamate synthase-like GNAT family acetyltransferase